MSLPPAKWYMEKYDDHNEKEEGEPECIFMS